MGIGEIATQAIHKSSVPQGDTAPKNISEIGLSRKQSSTFKQIADIPGADFENYVTEKKTDSELTTKGAVDFSKKLNKKKLTPMEEALLANKYGQQADRQKVLLAMARDVNNNTRSMEERRFVCARIKTESKI